MAAASPTSQFSPGFHAGAVPGRAVYTGPARDFQPYVRAFDWTADRVDELERISLEQAAALKHAESITWLDVVGVHDVEFVRKLGEVFGLHPLSIEDVVHPKQRPKIEYYTEYTYLVLKMPEVSDDGTVTLEQVSLVVGDGFVLTIQEKPGDVFEHVRDRLRGAVGRVRERKQDYFAYALMDAIVDGYVEAVDRIGEIVERAEEDLDENDSEKVDGLPQRLHDHKRELMALRKVAIPTREAVSTLLLNEGKRIGKRNLPFFRDLHDHAVQVVDSIEMYREMISNLVNLHLALVSQRTNEEMRVLTVIATIFIPLTFIVGVYGMNFEQMPELHLPWAYPALWVFMLATAGGLLAYFRRRRML